MGDSSGPFVEDHGDQSGCAPFVRTRHSSLARAPAGFGVTSKLSCAPEMTVVFQSPPSILHQTSALVCAVVSTARCSHCSARVSPISQVPLSDGPSRAGCFGAACSCTTFECAE